MGMIAFGDISVCRQPLLYILSLVADKVDWNLQKWTLTDKQKTGVDNAGLDNDRLECRE